LNNTRQTGRGQQKRSWRRMDLHLHTPGSSDYQESEVSYLDILRQAEARQLNAIAFADHNTVEGYAAMTKELEQLEWLEGLDRLQPVEKRRLDEYRRLLAKILVLPGFEFTATFGFHILAIFSPTTPVALLEHLLLTLKVPVNQLKNGSSTVGATSDVLTAYRLINENGGIVIAAHANSSNGVVMRGMDFGGQTKIAFTQDPNLHCLEVTDLDKNGRHTTRRFFDGSKPEYPKPMRCIQGSDAHRLVRASATSKNLGVGDRVTEILITEVTFEAIEEVLKGRDFSLTRPFRGPATPLDFVLLAREEGSSIMQAFHSSVARRGGHFDRILRDICAMANTNGGTIYVGISEDTTEPVAGIRDAANAERDLKASIMERFTPHPQVTIDSLRTAGKSVMRIVVEPGDHVPFAIDFSRIYIRDESGTNNAVRDEIVNLVRRGFERQGIVTKDVPDPAPMAAPVAEARRRQPAQSAPAAPRTSSAIAPPTTGVEVVESVPHGETVHHTVRDLRNGNLIKNVTKSSARKLWHYAITQAEDSPVDAEKLDWHGDRALIRDRRRQANIWYDVALRSGGKIQVFYGVTDSGLDDDWLAMIESQGK